MSSINGHEATPAFRALAGRLASIVRSFYHRGWTLGGSGCFSARTAEGEHSSFIVTPAYRDRSVIRPEDFLEVDSSGNLLFGKGQIPEALGLQVVIMETTGARAVFHTSSVWANVVCKARAAEKGVTISGHSSLQGLRGVLARDHMEFIPIVEQGLSAENNELQIENLLQKERSLHGILLTGQGLFCWGDTLIEAKRNTEILEFLLEVVGRGYFISGRAPNVFGINNRESDFPLHVGPKRPRG